FCSEVGITAEHFSRLTRTYKTFAPLDTRLNEFLADQRLSFKHFMIAAKAAQPGVALKEAADERWSANKLESVLAMRKGRYVVVDGAGQPVDVAPDDGDYEDIDDWRTMKRVNSRDGRQRLVAADRRASSRVSSF